MLSQNLFCFRESYIDLHADVHGDLHLRIPTPIIDALNRVCYKRKFHLSRKRARGPKLLFEATVVIARTLVHIPPTSGLISYAKSMLATVPDASSE